LVRLSARTKREGPQLTVDRFAPQAESGGTATLPGHPAGPQSAMFPEGAQIRFIITCKKTPCFAEDAQIGAPAR
jgi:hypothetical protein